MKIIMYGDVLSLWCLYGMRSIEAVRDAHPGHLEIEWRTSLVAGDRALGYNSEQNAWFYRRGARLTGLALNPGWLEGPLTGTREANLAVEAATHLGHGGLDVIHAVMRAAMVGGRPLGRREVAIEVVSGITGIPPRTLDEAMDDDEVIRRMADGAAEMAALGVDQRPVFHYANAIPDRAVLSGIWALEPLAALAEAMIADETAFLAFNSEDPGPSPRRSL